MRTVLFVALLAAAGMTHAQEVTVDSNSDSTANSSAGAVSGSQNHININSTAPDRQTIEHTGTQHIKTNSSVFLAAATSMSSDYCGGTASGGASAAGITIGAAKPIMDETCQGLRVAEKIGTYAVTAFNMGNKTKAQQLLSLGIWQLCVVETEDGNRKRASQVPSLEQACMDLGLIQDKAMDSADNPKPAE